jgi:hypothetical protein
MSFNFFNFFFNDLFASGFSKPIFFKAIVTAQRQQSEQYLLPQIYSILNLYQLTISQ